jgi:hypothetical protein
MCQAAVVQGAANNSAALILLDHRVAACWQNIKSPTHLGYPSMNPCTSCFCLNPDAAANSAGRPIRHVALDSCRGGCWGRCVSSVDTAMARRTSSSGTSNWVTTARRSRLSAAADPAFVTNSHECSLNKRSRRSWCAAVLRAKTTTSACTVQPSGLAVAAIAASRRLCNEQLRA